MHLVDRTDLFKTGNLDLGGKAIVMCLHSSLGRERGVGVGDRQTDRLKIDR
jgi:hypothetical protein